MTDRQKRALETRELLINKGRELITSAGMNDVTIDEITQFCGVSKGTFYHHFKSKNEFILFLTQSPYDALSERLKSLDYNNILECIELYMTEHIKLLREFGLSFTRQFFKCGLEDGSSASAVDQKVTYDTKVVYDLLARGIAAGSLREDTPLETLARLIITCQYGRTFCWCVQNGAFDPEALAKEQFLHFVKPCLEQYVTHKEEAPH